MNVKSDHVIGEKISPSFSTNEKQIQNQSYHVHGMFSRAFGKLQVIARNSGWFIALLAPVVIGRSNYPGIGSRQSCENRSNYTRKEMIINCHWTVLAKHVVIEENIFWLLFTVTNEFIPKKNKRQSQPTRNGVPLVMLTSFIL